MASILDIGVTPAPASAFAMEGFDKPFATVENFLPSGEAEALRRAAEAHFLHPYQHTPETHFVWDYWYVPGIYTYLRARPERVLGPALANLFHQKLQHWAKETLGMGHVTWPMLSLYVDGCGQGIHNDSVNGRFGYVFSLTRNERSSRGGETIVWKEGDPFRTRLDRSDAGVGLYDLIPPVFNRLVLFDDRMPHGVQRIEGCMDPLDGRLVLHGHISESGAAIDGPLSPQAVDAVVSPLFGAVFESFGESAAVHHGPLVLRLEIGTDGQVGGCRILVNRIARSDGGDPEPLVAALLEAVLDARFPPGGAASTVTLPILSGGLLPFIQERMRRQTIAIEPD